MIAVVDFGMGNLHSCLKAVSLYTKDFILTRNPADIEKSSGIILPGDGAFQKAMENLQEYGLLQTLKASAGRIPLFGICIGYQLLFESSEETHDGRKEVPGLGLIPGKVKKFSGKNYKIPHMGWNRLLQMSGSILNEVTQNSFMYFIHSYRPVDVPVEYAVAYCDYYEETFPVVVEKDNIYGTQFHPEKSWKEGLKILKNFINKAQA